jgi:hypothetical protein
MRGIVLKNHYDPTGGLAYIVRKEVPGLEVFGGVDLNLTVGGINPAAVSHMAEVSGRWGTNRLDADIRFRKSGALFQRESSIRSRVAQWRIDPRGKGSRRVDRQAWPGSGHGSPVAG